MPGPTSSFLLATSVARRKRDRERWTAIVTMSQAASPLGALYYFAGSG